MTRTFLTAFATLGMVIAGAVTSVLLVGVAEGIRPLPDLVASFVGVGVFLAAMALAGRVAVDVGDRTPSTGAARGWVRERRRMADGAGDRIERRESRGIHGPAAGSRARGAAHRQCVGQSKTLLGSPQTEVVQTRIGALLTSLADLTCE